MSRTSITNMEKGSQPVALHTVLALADLVGVPPNALIPSRAVAGPEPRRLTRAAPEDRELILRFLNKTLSKDEAMNAEA